MGGSIDLNMRKAALNALDLAARTDQRRIAPSVSGDGSMRRWHVVRVAAKFERQAADETSFVAKQIAQAGFEVYSVKLRRMIVPRANQLSREQRKARHLLTKEKIEAMFPGYEFVRFDTAADPWHDIFRIIGVYGLVCENNLPAPIADDFIAKLRAAEINGAIPAALPATELFAAGTIVRITKAGAFKGLTGPIERLDAVGRIRLLLDLFGGSVPVEMTIDDIEKL
jgi:transcription antitermination factor NusG